MKLKVMLEKQIWHSPAISPESLPMTPRHYHRSAARCPPRTPTAEEEGVKDYLEGGLPVPIHITLHALPLCRLLNLLLTSLHQRALLSRQRHLPLNAPVAVSHPIMVD